MSDSPLIGTDFAERCRLVGEALEADLPDKLRREREAADRAERALEGLHRYLVLVKPSRHGVVVETIDHPPLVGKLSARGRSLPSALVELRFAYATALVEQHLLPDGDTARRYCTKVEWLAQFDVPKIIGVVR